MSKKNRYFGARFILPFRACDQTGGDAGTTDTSSVPSRIALQILSHLPKRKHLGETIYQD